ncbi:tetratricopeptide repeat protein [Geminocystis sp. CENA526]|uniref:tetratricopeptide repeat protein n=1 Tax=Geminocystis sp. CENA526 TaxID=1355871 RepID=UPI003D6F59CB
MNFNNFISPFVIGVATLTVIQPQMVFAQNRQDINIIAKSITVRIDGREYGTGVIVNRQGNTYTVLTNWHVVGNEGKQRVTTFDNQSHEINPSSIQRVGNFDLAIFEFTANKNYGIAEIVDEPLTESATIYITGYPKPRPPIDGRIYQFTEGYISGINPQEKQGYTLVYTNQTRPGMSGAPILNSQGKLVGIHGLSEGAEVEDSETGTTRITPLTDGYKLGIPINNYLGWAGNNQVATNSNISNFNQQVDQDEVTKNLEIDKYIIEGLIYSELKNHEKAISEYDQAIKLDPNNTLTYIARGVSYGELGEYDKAISDYTKVISLDPNYAVAYNNRGFTYNSLGEYDKAIADYTKTISLDPNYAVAYNNRGGSYNELGEYQKAIADFTKAINLDPNYATAYNNRGSTYNSLGEYQKAIPDLTKAINLDPNNAPAYYHRGFSYNNLGEYQKAIADFTNAISLDSSYAEAYVMRGLSYISVSQYEKALSDLTNAKSLFIQQGNTEAVKIIEDILQ